MTTGYEVCQALVAAMEAEVMDLKAKQRRRGPDDSFVPECQRLADGCVKLQGELRKTGATADKAVNNLSPEKQLDLILKFIQAMSPDHRRAVRLFLDELGEKLL